jgi:hypothetical protein
MKHLYKIDLAPGKEIIPKINDGISFDEFYNFYQIRKEWHGAYLMSDRMSTHTIFKDLEDHMRKNGMPHYLVLYAEQVKKNENNSELSINFSEGMKELYEFIKKRRLR